MLKTQVPTSDSFSFGGGSDGEGEGDVDVDKELDMLERELNGDGVGDEEPELDDDDDDLAADVVASDAMVLEDIVTAAQLSIRLKPLTAVEANIGCLSIAKVWDFINRVAPH